ncbi:thioredoxin [Corynebacterium incognita]|uniref:Thioredoxin n=1 Tax=Corynebacterium incognita TaxID=2754725 RepID=A0A7G7CLZ7_9CORY|nr:thioredoxin [Corynebacterium incognita]QNE88613.1 thioredoxin [Corynebacterium incognita]
MSNIIDVTTETFRSSVVDSDKLTVVDFWAPWCGPCKKLSPLLEEISDEMGDDVQIAKVNVDEERNLGAMFQIMSIPTVLIFKDGEKVSEFTGLRPKASIVAAIEKHK